jgi:hypothetical protein
MQELLGPDAGTRVVLVAPGQDDGPSPTRPELHYRDRGLDVRLFTVGADLEPVLWQLRADHDGVRITGDAALADHLRETVELLAPHTVHEALGAVVLGLAKSVSPVLDEAGERALASDELKRHELRARRTHLATLRELLSTQARELEELEQEGSLGPVDAHHRHAVRRARHLFDDGSRTAQRFYEQAGDELGERSVLVNERLTLVSTVFLPATVTTGFFGMNFAWLTRHIESPLTFALLGIVVPLLVSLATYAVVQRLRVGRG